LGLRAVLASFPFSPLPPPAVSKLYDEVILDHIRNARNYRVIDAPGTLGGEAVNPLCGDTFQVHVEQGTVRDAAFQCECCGISMASASVMTEWVKGRSVAEALQARQAFMAAVTSRSVAPLPGAPEDHAAVLQLLANTPSREGCALLAWTALEQALAARG
jgi:nitrogen fixation NifU-like protein